MKQLSNFFILFLCWAKLCLAQYEGPYLLFGLRELDKVQIPSLRAIDDRLLRELYSNATSVMVFVKNSTTKLNYENFPKLSELIQKNCWLYLPQHALSSDPLDFNVNAEVFKLTGSNEQQDVEIAALFRDSQITYGDNHVLGLLATAEVTESQRIFKRQAEESTTTTTEPATENSDNSVTFEVKGKALLYSEGSPILQIQKNLSTPETIYLKKNAIVTSDERNDVFRIVVRYPATATYETMYFKFNFHNSSGHWFLDEVEVDVQGLNLTTLNIIGSPPSAPMGFSFGCNQSFVYQYRNLTSQILVTLTINMIQVQPFINSGKTENEITKFGRVYECVGILTPSIASGIFVTSIIAIGLTIAITAIMDIKPPNKFESKGSKQLTFTVQE